MGIVNFITANWVAIIAVVLGALEVARQVAKLTPSTADDELVAKIEGVLDQFGVKPAPGK